MICIILITFRIRTVSVHVFTYDYTCKNSYSGKQKNKGFFVAENPNMESIPPTAAPISIPSSE